MKKNLYLDSAMIQYMIFLMCLHYLSQNGQLPLTSHGNITTVYGEVSLFSSIWLQVSDEGIPSSCHHSLISRVDDHHQSKLFSVHHS